MVKTRSQGGNAAEEGATADTPTSASRGRNPEPAHRVIHFETPRSLPDATEPRSNIPADSRPREEAASQLRGRPGPSREEDDLPFVAARTTELPRRHNVSPARSVGSVRSARSTGSTAARIRQAQYDAEEKLALLKKKELELEAERIRRRLNLDIDLIRDSEETTAEPTERTERSERVGANVEQWMASAISGMEPLEHRAVPERGTFSEREQTRSGTTQLRTRSPTPHRNTSRTRGIDQLVEALEKISRHRPPPRQTYELPLFSGGHSDWFPFKAAMRDTTRLYGFSAAENMARLRNCLRGEAKEAVSALLHTVEDPDVVMKTLEQCFGRPEVLVDRTIQELRALPKPGLSASELNFFAVKVQNTVSVLRAIDHKGYLFNPMLTRDVLDKLSPHLRSRWCDYAEDHAASADPQIIVLSRFLIKEADRALRHAYTTPTAALNSATAKKDPGKNPPKKKPVYATDDAPTAPDRSYKCIKCTGDHVLSGCPKFKALSLDDRWELVKKEGLCFKCIASHHRRMNCTSKSCGVNGCRHPHNPLLHSDRASPRPAASQAENIEVVTATITATVGQVLLKICPVTVSGPRGKIRTYALLDEGSTVSLMDDSLARDIGAEGPSKPLSISGVSMEKLDPTSRNVSFQIQGADNKSHRIRARTIDRMRLRTQTIPEQLLRLNHLVDLDQANVCYEQSRPRVLIGADNWDLIVSRELRLGRRNQPAASRTNLGWVIHGTLPRTILKQGLDEVFHVVASHDERLENLVQQHFAIDALGISLRPRKIKHEERAVEIFERTAKLSNGHFEVGLPWREDEPRTPSSYAMAWRRLRTLESKLDKNPTMKIEYEQQIQNLFNKGYAEACTENEVNSSRAWYLPHFAVTNPNKPGKIRLVFDAAAKAHGLCLNDFLLEGPDLLQSLPKILFRFRENKIAVTADIQEMFLQIKIRAEDQPAQLFLWRGSDRSEAPKEYKMTSMIFGASSSPFLAHSVRNKNAEAFKNEHPEAVRAIQEAHYMDDFVDSFTSERDASKIVQEVDKIHRACGFKLRSWNSNSKKIMKNIPAELRSQNQTQLLSGLNAPEKTLGLTWDSEQDTLGFNTLLNRVSRDVKNLHRPPSKREALSAVMSLFDPLGLLSCFSITGKILLQNLWRKQLTWDQTLPEPDASHFMNWLHNIQQITTIQQPRCYDREEVAINRQLHVFCDASEHAFAAAAYWRLEKPDGTANTILITAKAKVAPLRAQTIPRLELQAALIGTRLAATVKNDHRWPIDEVNFWTDSTTVLHWIQNDTTSKKHPPFVAHRLGEISEATRPDQWRWIPTNYNVADLATRPGYVPTNQDWWFTGPEFLRHPKNAWPDFTSPAVQENQEDEEVLHLDPQDDQNDCLPDIKRFSKYERLIRATALVLVFIDKCRKKTTTMEAHHLTKAERLWTKRSQQDSFEEELSLIRRGRPIPIRSRLHKLDPILAADGLLCLNGRIGAADVPEEAKKPIIMDSRHQFTKLLILKVHQAAGHANQERVVNDLRQQYWILRLRPAVKAAARDCALCRVRKTLPRVPVTGDLPAARLQPYQRPFSNCGVDYFGPLIVTVGRRHEKRWGALFTCLTTRAVHLELVHTLSTDSAIMALRRMAARRGWPAVIWSDNGTNFRGADVELRAAYAEWVPALRDFGLLHRVSWRFIPPGAPNQGGAWERLVRSVKVALTATLNQKTPRDEVLQTVLIEAEHGINARPLTHVPVNPDDPEALTPNHFLLGSSIGLPSTGPCELADRRVWRASQALADEFWRRWVREYLPTLVPRQGANQPARDLQPGDLVVVVDSSLPRNTWPRGVVERTYPGPDGHVRSAEIRTRNGIFRRPTTKLAVLRVEGSADATPGGELLATASPVT